MCSWCWGFHPSWKALQEELAPLIKSSELTIRPLLGGLAPDSDEPMPDEMREFLQSTWQRMESLLGTKFNYDFWRDCQPRRSTYPACRACLVARDQGLESEMSLAIEHAYYLQANNPSDLDTLTKCAEEIGMQAEGFTQAMRDTKESERLEVEIREARQMELNSFPSFAVVSNDRIIPITLDYQNPQKMAVEIKTALKSIA